MVLLDEFYRYTTTRKPTEYSLVVDNIEEVKRIEQIKNIRLPKNINLYSYDKKSKLFYIPYSYSYKLLNRQTTVNIWKESPKLKTKDIPFELRWWQKDLIKFAKRKSAMGGRSILIYWKPWVGKTTGICALLHFYHTPAVIVTPTKKIQQQFYTTLQNFFYKEDLSAPVASTLQDDGIGKNILILTYATFNKIYDRLNWHYPILVIDEAHNLPKSRIKQINEWKNCLLVVGASATPYRQELNINWMKQYWWQILEVPDEEVKRYTLPVKVYHYIINLDYSIEEVIDKDIDLLQSKADRQLFYEDKRLYSFIQKIVDKLELEGIKKILILTEQTKQVEYLLNNLKTKKKLLRYDGKITDKQREEVEKEFKELDEFVIVANEKAVKEWFDLPALEAGILAYPTKRRWAIEQAVWRVQRLYPGKEYWIWVDIDIRYRVWDSKPKVKSWYDRLKHYQSLWFEIINMS